MRTYRVQLIKDSTYEVIEKTFASRRETWLSILQNSGSVQHLDFLSEESIFQGSIVECESYIRLKEKGKIT